MVIAYVAEVENGLLVDAMTLLHSKLILSFWPYIIPLYFLLLLLFMLLLLFVYVITPAMLLLIKSKT